MVADHQASKRTFDHGAFDELTESPGDTTEMRFFGRMTVVLGRGLAVWAAGMALLAGEPIVAAEVALSLADSATAASVKLRAEPLMAESVDIQGLELEVAAPWRGALPLDPRYAWRIHAEAVSLWSAPRELAIGQETQTEISLLPAAWIEATLKEAELRVDFGWAAPQRDGKKRSFEQLAGGCLPFNAGKSRCKLPAGRLDVRLSVPGRVPHYLWAIELVAGKTLDLGALRFEPGASIAGWVVSAEGLPEGVAISADPATTVFVNDSDVQSRAKLRTARSKADERGFFQLSGISPGKYRLVAVAGQLLGHAEAEVFPDAETRLEAAVELFPPMQIELAISPPLDPYGRPWTVAIGQLVGKAIPGRELAAAADEGLWRLRPRDPGTYELTVEDVRGSTWHSELVELLPDRERLFIDIDRIEVEGRAFRGDDPIEAEIVFGTTQGTEQIAMQSDAEGKFEGFLPRPGRWMVDVVWNREEMDLQTIEPIEVMPKPGSSRAFVEIELPNTEIAGVVRKEGQPIADARLMALRGGDKRRRESMGKTDRQGRFSIRGIEPGKVIVGATHGKSASDWHEVEVSENEIHELVIEIEEKVALSGFLHAAGQPLFGAVVMVQPQVPGRVVTLSKSASLLDGEFEVKVSAKAQAFDVIVRADGFGTRLLGVSGWTPARPLPIELDRQRGRIHLLSALPDPRQQSEAVLSLDLISSGASSARLNLRNLVSVASVEPREDGLALLDFAPGTYRVCTPSGRCLSRELQAGGEAVFDLKEIDR